MIDREKMIDIAGRVLCLEKLARDPEFVLAAAEALLRDAHVDGVRLYYFDRGASDTNTMDCGDRCYHGELREAYAAAMKQRDGGEHG